MKIKIDKNIIATYMLLNNKKADEYRFTAIFSAELNSINFK